MNAALQAFERYQDAVAEHGRGSQPAKRAWAQYLALGREDEQQRLKREADEDARNCEFCGHTMPEDSNWCPGCGELNTDERDRW